MPDHHVKGQPAAPTYVREKGCLKSYSNRETPCSSKKEENFVPIFVPKLIPKVVSKLVPKKCH